MVRRWRAYDTLINGLKQELPPDFKLPPGVFGPDYDTTDEPAKTTKGKGKQDDKDGGETSGESGESGNLGEQRRWRRYRERRDAGHGHAGVRDG